LERTFITAAGVAGGITKMLINAVASSIAAHDRYTSGG